ncbi:MAG TPA: DUF2403 domain-containing protein [Polyangiaceae bacterium]|nr:DUF2403 domain-containing protein [Polyangiaceae bacterium]
MALVASTAVACSSSGHASGARDAGATATGGTPQDGGKPVSDGAGGKSGGDGGRAASGGSTASGGSNASGGNAPSQGGAMNANGGSMNAAGGSTQSTLPGKCDGADAGPAGDDVFTPNTGKQAVTALTYTNVGASGSYAQVVDGWSKATGCVGDTDGTLCKTKYKLAKSVSGALAPFDEEMAMVFAGPAELYQVAVYQPAGSAWNRVAYWDPCTTDGLVFAGNKHWFECAGDVESYVTADGTKESATPVEFAGHLAAGTELNIMSSALCNGKTAASDCGYSQGLPLHGFGGDAAGSKIFATKFRMPLDTKTPAYWILPAQVIRTNQYGCNCRGQGSDPTYKGGCGELDVAEILGGVTTSREATTTLYSFQDITGGGSVAFNRPVDHAAVFLVIFDAPSKSIGIRRLDDFGFESALTADAVKAYLADQGTVRALE